MDERENRPEEVPSFLWNVGDVFAPKPVRDVLDRSYTQILGADVNGWTGMHALSGVLAKRMGMGMGTAFTVHGMWELWQEAIGMSGMERVDAVDKFVDTAAFMGGYFVA